MDSPWLTIYTIYSFIIITYLIMHNCICTNDKCTNVCRFCSLKFNTLNVKHQKIKFFRWQGVYNSFLCPLNVCPDQNYLPQPQPPSFSPLPERAHLLDLDFYLCHVLLCIYPPEEQLSVCVSSFHACLLSWREYPGIDMLLTMMILNLQHLKLKKKVSMNQRML